MKILDYYIFSALGAKFFDRTNVELTAQVCQCCGGYYCIDENIMNANNRGIMFGINLNMELLKQPNIPIPLEDKYKEEQFRYETLQLGEDVITFKFSTAT